MTEKRFEYYEHKGADYILDTPNKSLDFIEMLGDTLEAEEIVELLNSLNDENEHLKQKLLSKEDIIQQMKIKLNEDYYKKWKKTNLNYIRVCEELAEENRAYEKLSEENEQLKKEMGDLGTYHAEEINKIEDEFDEEILKLEKENEQLKQYKQAVSDVLLSYSQKNLSAKQLGLLTAIMHELGVME